MKRLVAAVLITALGGFASFLFGQSLPRCWFDPEGAMFKCRPWEKGGKVYHKVWVHKWKDIVPDMSRIIPGVFKKKASIARSPELMGRLVLETCVAEFIHWLLIAIISPAVFVALGGWEGALAAAVYALGNLVFVIIQRYNRPRLVEIHKRMEKRREKCS